MSAGWDAIDKAVAEAQREVAAHAPDADVAAEGKAYVMRVVASSLTDAFLGHLFLENGLGRALPTRGGPNPHYAMASARIDPARRYRFEGQLNDSERVGVGLYSLGENGAPLEVGYAAFDRTNSDADGRFSLDITSDASGPGRLSIPPQCRVLVTRTLHRDPGGKRARLSLFGGEQVTGLALATGTSEGALARAAQTVVSSVREYLKWTRVAASKPNRFDIPAPELAATVQGDRDTSYYLGYFDLGPGEWLEVCLPDEPPGYWSINIYNHWFESLQVDGVHDRNALKDSDGAVRVQIGPCVPGKLANRIDTMGRTRGALICRIIGARKASMPEARLIRAGSGSYGQVMSEICGS
jgi:hypothetical protein